MTEAYAAVISSPIVALFLEFYTAVIYIYIHIHFYFTFVIVEIFIQIG
jgi:hypothetical protein